jgi:hypothetical protein
MHDPDTIRRLESQLRSLRRYTILSTLTFMALGTLAFTTRQGTARFTEIEVERINVVEADGRHALVIANAARLPGPIIRGREYPREISGGRTEASGLLFFNHEGTEAGGLTYGSVASPRGVSAGGSFTFDRMNQDHVVQVAYQEDAGRVFAGVQVWDRPQRHIQGFLDLVMAQRAGTIDDAEFVEGAMAEIQGTVPRIRLGSARRSALLDINDTRGRPRIRLVVDSMDVARLEFRDPNGRLVLRLPEN